MKTLPTLPLLLLWLVLPAQASDRTPPPVEPATSYPAVEVHDDEHVAIAVEPYDTKQKASIFRFDFLGHNIMPVRLIVTNLGDKPISLRDARILFETAAGDRIQAAEPEDVERTMTRKEREKGKIPLPVPLPPISTKPKSSIREIEQDFDTFEYSALAVEPHTTRAGFLFYDVSGLSNPLLGARLYLHKLRKADGSELFFFEIPFNKYLKSKPSPAN